MPQLRGNEPILGLNNVNDHKHGDDLHIFPTN